jgi:hypothetical protein
VHSGDEIVWTDVVAAYNTCKKLTGEDAENWSRFKGML